MRRKQIRRLNCGGGLQIRFILHPLLASGFERQQKQSPFSRFCCDGD